MRAARQNYNGKSMLINKDNLSQAVIRTLDEHGEKYLGFSFTHGKKGRLRISKMKEVFSALQKDDLVNLLLLAKVMAGDDAGSVNETFARTINGMQQAREAVFDQSAWDSIDLGSYDDATSLEFARELEGITSNPMDSVGLKVGVLIDRALEECASGLSSEVLAAKVTGLTGLLNDKSLETLIGEDGELRCREILCEDQSPTNSFTFKPGAVTSEVASGSLGLSG